jgi:pimeloyl-ACP methyl ester carboxylesterase
MRLSVWLAALSLGVALAGPAPAQAPQPWTTLRATVPLPPPVKTGYVRSGDVEIYYAIYGRGRPVLLIHPGLGHGDYWSNQVGPLSQIYQVIVVDLRGHGRSTRSDTPLSYELMGDDVTHLIRTLNIEKPAVVGWGDGAIVGLEMALHHPKRIGELIVFGMAHDVTGLRPAVDQTPTFVEYVHKTAADYERLAPEPKNFGATVDQMEALWETAPHYTAADLARVKAPTTVLVAEHDEWVIPEHAEQAATLIPGAQSVWLPKVSHFAPWQAPKKFTDALKLILAH